MPPAVPDVPSTIEVDLARMLADLDRLERVRAEARQASAAALAAEEVADENYHRQKAMIEALRNYAVHSAGPLTSGPLTGLNGSKAVREFARSNPGRVMRLDEIVDEMQREGFEGTDNAIAVALSGMYRSGEIGRPGTGTYIFSATDRPEHERHEAGSVVSRDPVR